MITKTLDNIYHGAKFLFVISVTAIFEFLVISILSVYVIFSWQTHTDFENEAIEKGYIIYCPKTGEMKWKDEC